MADKNIQMTQRNAANDGWDNLYPKTKGVNVVANDGTTTFESHSNDNVKHVNQNLLDKINDNGRYQSDFGFDSAVLNNVDITNGIASITNTVVGSPLSLSGTWSTYSLTYGQGFVIQPKMLISKLVLGIYSGQSGYSRLRILKYSDNSVIATQTVTGLLTVTFDNLNLQVGTKYKLVLDNNGSAWTEAQVNSFSSFPITTSSEFDVINSIHNDADSSLYLQAFSSIQAYSNTALTGTVTKTYTPSDLKKWGNAKWTQTTPPNTSVVCDVLDPNSLVNAVPVMTSNTAPSGVASDSASTGNAFACFDGKRTVADGAGGFTFGTSVLTGWVQYQFPQAKIITSYSVWSNSSGSTSAPKNWTLKGSNNGTNWTTIDTVTNNTGCGDYEKRTFIVDTPNSYFYYRLDITANNGDATYLRLGEFELYTDPIILKSNLASIADLSDLNITQYLTLAIRWTLTRNSLNDTSPIIKDASITWEGKQFQANTWEKITEVAVAGSAVNQIDFISLSSQYKRFKIICDTMPLAAGSANLKVIINDIVSSNYLNNMSTGTLGYGTLSTALNSGGACNVLTELDIENTVKYTIGMWRNMVYSIGVTNGGFILQDISKINKISLITSDTNYKIPVGSIFTLWGCK